MRALVAVLLLASACVTAAGQPAIDDLRDLPHLPTSHGIDLPLTNLGIPGKGAFFQISLGPRPPIVVGMTRVERTPTGFTWRGTVGTRASVLITSRGGKAIGTIFTATQTYRIVRGPGGYRIVLVPPATRKLRETRSDAFRHGSIPSRKSEVGPIRILAAYTSGAARECTDIETLIEHGVDLTNDVAENTRVSTRFALAGVHETDYADAKQSAETVLRAFADTDDTQMNEIHALRVSEHADIALLFVAPEGGLYDGLSAQTTADYATAFSVVNCHTALDYLVMPHEIGHLLGLNDDDDLPGANVFGEGYGHYNRGNNAAHCWRTIMATPQDCTCCRPIPFWSNPDVHYPTPVDAATGVEKRSNNAYVIGQTAGVVSRFEPMP